MHWFRKVLVALFALILFFTAINIAWAVAINQSIGNPEQIKTWLTNSKIYDNAVSAVLNSTQNDNDKQGSDGSISLKDPTVQQAAKEAFSPQLLQTSVNTFIDANYAWLSGKTATPDFKIDLTQAKSDFATKVGAAVTTRLTGLTVCTSQQQAMLQIPVNVLTVSCRPASLDPATEGARVTGEIKNNDFLSNPVITADTIAHDPKSNTKVYYVKAAKAPEVYQAQQKAPYILGLLAVVCILAIIFIAKPRRKGWRRIASTLLVVGILLIASKFVGDYATKRLEDQVGKSKTFVSQLHQPTNDLIEHVESGVVQTNLYFGIGYALIAIIIYIVLRKTREGSGKSKSNKPYVPPKDPSDNKPEPRRSPTPVDATGTTQKPTGPPVFKTPQPTAKRKPQKPPRLIQ
jgi:hypothetical protein